MKIARYISIVHLKNALFNNLGEIDLRFLIESLRIYISSNISSREE
jgi:hypothetical protein